MLSKLYIKNFAIIQELQVDFHLGLITLTGETGAGKSIILGSIQLLLGARADLGVIFPGADKCIVEGTFAIDKNKAAQSFLIAHDLECTDELIVRREILNSGRSRAFVNDTPVNLSVLQDLGELLVDLHRQFDSVEMRSGATQLNLLDQLANNEKELEAYQNYFSRLGSAETKLSLLKKEQQTMQQAFDYNNFQFQELADLNFKPNEIEDAEATIKVLSNAEGVISSLQFAMNELQDSEHNTLLQIKKVVGQLQSYASSLPPIDALVQRLEQVRAEVKDIVYEVDSLTDKVEINPEQLHLIEERFNEGTRLMKKHGVANTDELLAVMKQFESALLQSADISVEIETLQTEVAALRNQLMEAAQKLTATREKAAVSISKKVNVLLPKVGMPNAQLQIGLQPTTFVETGSDIVQFLLDANKTGSFAPIGKIASGGELSRIILSIKSLLAQQKHLPTLIFDEIDTGISGETARQVGLLMKEMSEIHQLIVVTHLPQIAAKAKTHLHVYKSAQKDGSLVTSIRLLDKTEQLKQVAEMLSGSDPTDAAIKAAKELINE